MDFLLRYTLQDLRRLEMRIKNTMTADKVFDLCIGFCKRNELTLDELFKIQAMGGGPDLEAKFEMAFGAHGVLEHDAKGLKIDRFNAQHYLEQRSLQHPAADPYYNQVNLMEPDPDVPLKPKNKP